MVHAQCAEVQSSATIVDGAFHHVALTYDGATMKIYVDGHLSNSRALAGFVNSVTGGKLVLGNATAYNNSLDGLIDEVRIWNYARTESQIVGSMNGEISPSAGLVGYWQMNGNGTDLASGNTMVPNSGATFSAGKFGLAADTPPNSYFEAPALSAYSVMGSLTVECWVKVRSEPGPDPRIMRCIGPTDGPCPGVGVEVWEMAVCSQSACNTGAVQAGFQHSGTPIQWPGNGHYYVRVSTPTTWTAACATASSSTFQGLAGHLATITSSEENSFIYTTLLAALPAGFNWIGGSQPPGSPEPNSSWGWVTGESWAYTAWGSGEPSDMGSLPNEDAVGIDNSGVWNDGCAEVSVPYIVEYEPGSFGCSAVDGCVGASLEAGSVGVSGRLQLAESIPLENRALAKQSGAATSYLYPGACADRAGFTWAPRTSPQADSLNGYTPGSTGPYGVADLSLSEVLWHVSDNVACTSGTDCPPSIGGTRMLWCGRYDAGWATTFGYPNSSYQILYIDTGSHGGNYNLTFDYQFSSELGYDFVWLIGGGGGATDPIGNSRSQLDNIIATGAYLVQWTGSIRPTTANATGANTTAGPIDIADASGSPITVTGASFTIDGSNRALYLVFKSDGLSSSEDGLWPQGHGQQIDNIATSDNGVIYAEQAAAGGIDSFFGNVLVGTPGAPVVSARVAPGLGTRWQLVQGSNMPTPDTCTPKNATTDLIFMGGDSSTKYTVPNQFNSIIGCTFPVPSGTRSIRALWDTYSDLPMGQGYVRYCEYRFFRSGRWSTWSNTSPGGWLRVGAEQAWQTDADELAGAVRADSVQVRYNMQCIPFSAADHQNCGDVIYGVLYDNFRLEVTPGTPVPGFGIFVGSLAQSTFVDGTMEGSGCNGSSVASGTCWPGVRGSDTGTPGAVHDNFNSPLGDSITVGIATGVGINWHQAFDKNVNAGLTIAHLNPNFLPFFDSPRVIYRLFDPATKTWSPFDSSELDVDNVSPPAVGTALVDNLCRMNWPPRDKAGSSLPAGFSVNGRTLYSQLAFLPHGARLQYYWKGVDLSGATSYQFSSDAVAREVEDLPTLPGSSIVAPDIIEFDVLPRVYSPAGSSGTLVAGRTNTPLLDLDGSYTRWSYGSHATVQALRALGVRSDRYRTLQGLEEGGHIGGHELAGTRVGRWSNYFPNMDEYGIKDSLAGWYRILIESSHTSTWPVDEESDARLIKEWWETSTGTDGGDRCIFASGDDYFNTLLAPSGLPQPHENALATSVFGVAASANQWNGGNSNAFPLIKDLFADPAAGPALGFGSYTYKIDGGCPAPNRFDALTKIGSAEAQNAATYPTIASVTNVAGVSYMTERDVSYDHDRNKALGYGFSIQLIRQGGQNLLDNRAQVLYKFLASCRGPRSSADTAACWPCPTDANKYGNWAILSGFQTGTYGPLYAIQNGNLAAAGVEEPGPETPRFLNALSQNRPNPFNPETLIPYSVATRGNVTIRIYDISGRCVRTLVDAVREPGLHQARWAGQLDSGGKAASSIYFYRITYPDGTTSAKKMAILR